MLGVAQYRAADPAAAIESLEKAAELLGGGGATVPLYLAMAHWQKGEAEEARQCYARAVERVEKKHLLDAELDFLRTETEEVLRGPIGNAQTSK